jgi:hypothetical protein
MKKLFLILIPLVFLSFLCLFILFPKKTTTPTDGKFGFLREVINMDIEKIEDMGATWLRPGFGFFVWGEMQKSENGPIDFTKTDEVVLGAQKHNLNLLITIFPYADWDQKDKGDLCKVSVNDEMLPRSKEGFVVPGLPYYRCNPSNWSAYEKWLTSLVERYDGDGKDDMKGLKNPILYYEINNEPDLTKDPNSNFGMVFYIGKPADYALLLQKSYTAIKKENGNVNVLTAAMAGVQSNFVEYWKGVFSTPNISSFFDIANVHSLSAPNQDKNDPTSMSANDLNVTAYKNLLLSYNITKPIWVTEAENVQGNNVNENVKRLKESVNNALNNGAEKIFFTGLSFAGDPMRYTSEILISERGYYKEIIFSVK